MVSSIPPTASPTKRAGANGLSLVTKATIPAESLPPRAAGLSVRIAESSSVLEAAIPAKIAGEILGMTIPWAYRGAARRVPLSRFGRWASQLFGP